MRIYIAHPSFTEEQEQFKTLFISMLRDHLVAGPYGKNIAIVDPFLFSINAEGDRETKIRESSTIKTTCLRLLEECDVVIAVTDWNDTGTAFEAGYAHAINIPVILVSRDTCADANAMLLGAAREMIDNILGEKSMAHITAILNWFHLSLQRFPADPHTN